MCRMLAEGNAAHLCPVVFNARSQLTPAATDETESRVDVPRKKKAGLLFITNCVEEQESAVFWYCYWLRC